MILRDRRKAPEHQFFRVRNVIFEALVRQHLGEAAYSQLVGSASEKAKTLLMLAKEKEALVLKTPTR